ncbi:NADPH-dependent 7-cyano-7-deazaguanine reductase QueF [Alcaligenes ammonioxydans]|uniref:NADPH-dependent 7-cyano-7-deazaguanine reductase n=1 Tax=Alcaligenes ammonioxydans TaxID=2582914 RepID=A0ABX8SU18_9BURK|nr:NADPH-dependent 7-cyano-7-deazaguanine reductase QueF [Alcaligenes ammonioxydans]EJC65255.1 7-cyano-7-deazaguanine reductase [Alcaligenes faecalis subsp. faecalis NCIB 8687]QBH18346.1 NADPH-dependent 7-cyano-7-deazaguanine reductase QueF [Alcaligenes faecalis]MCH1878105.1 NADPH-dependent 7-cyano-7-deazaguanine reductase QueF [Alcaligenes ammonioxydans]QXX79500.1 NADPH-dependent 7-cyano-7-deazaguanine reductase QueF [Alcaligenes ammonioxydans]WGQ34427.1 NADPH-dependent 7-cyano-7-deazaguanine
MSNTSPLKDSPLGHDVVYPTRYDPNVLFGIERSLNRQALELPEQWYGADIWNGYEVSWLNPKGKPVVALARFVIPWNSPRIIESKSFKLYLNSFNDEVVQDSDSLAGRMEQDLSAIAGAPVQVTLWPLSALSGQTIAQLEGRSIDELDISIQDYTPQSGLLACLPDAPLVTESLVSDLLKSNCPVTGQPDWGSVQVRYTGPQIDPASLLRYIVSLRRHTEFHEHCVERLYSDIWQSCQPERLLVYARYTRRGGLDINPWRSSHADSVQEPRLARQ